MAKNTLLIATNLTSICCVYKEKIDKSDSYRIEYRPSQLRKLQFVKKLIYYQTNYLHIKTFSHRLFFDVLAYS